MRLEHGIDAHNGDSNEDGEMTTIAVIPARGGSKGIPQKNLAKVAGKSLVERAIEAARGTPGIGAILVSSDDDDILEEGRRCGAVTSRRPPELSTDDAPTSAVVNYVLRQEAGASIVVVLQPTSPLRRPEDIQACLRTLEWAASAATVVALNHPAEWLFDVGDQGHLMPLNGDWDAIPTCRQSGRPAYELNGAVYAATAAYLRAGNPLVGPRTVAVQMPRYRSIDVDTLADLRLANLLAAWEEAQ